MNKQCIYLIAELMKSVFFQIRQKYLRQYKTIYSIKRVSHKPFAVYSWILPYNIPYCEYLEECDRVMHPSWSASCKYKW